MQPYSIFRVTSVVFVSALAASSLSACADAPPPRSATASDAPSRAIDRPTAIAEAQRDAALRFGAVPAARIAAQQTGGVWIVELFDATGGGLRYAISTQDGSIRERNTFQ